jgi:DnaK suppressor protein
MFKEREMAAKRPVAKSAKAHTPVAAKAAAGKRATAAKTAPPPKLQIPAKPSAAVLDKKPAVSPPTKKSDKKKAPPEQVLPVEVDPLEDADGAEGPDSPDSNLLAGPRNVKAYIPARGEQYMNKEQLGHFRTILQTWKQDLMMGVDRTVSHMKDEAANFPDPNDRATQEEEFSLELRTRDRERKLIRKIDEAIKRIEDGSYGYCLETGEHIGIKRLEARPVATLSIEAQERRERREKQYGDRDDRYR